MVALHSLGSSGCIIDNQVVNPVVEKSLEGRQNSLIYGMEARAGNPASPVKSLIINDLRKANFGLLYHLLVSNQGAFGKIIPLRLWPLSSRLCQSADIGDFSEVVHRRTIGRRWNEGGGLPSLPVCSTFKNPGPA